jgi:hypothetical protein
MLSKRKSSERSGRFSSQTSEHEEYAGETIKEAREMMMSPVIDQTTLNAHIEKRQALANDLIRFVLAKFTEIHDSPRSRETNWQWKSGNLRAVHMIGNLC